MAEVQIERMCVLLPVAERLLWAVPQRSLAEVLTISADSETPPATVDWRGRDIPVLDIGAGGKAGWRISQTGTGLLAVFLGLGDDSARRCWALALRGPGLAFRDIVESDCEERPEELRQNSLAAFTMDNEIYQVPDLPLLQERAHNPSQVAVPA